MNLINKAINKAYEMHGGQKRKKSDFPYFVHILDVTKYLMYETKEESVICAGVLHDTLEDSDYTEDKLLEEFGQEVYDLVKFCTEPENTPDASKEEQKASWRRRKEHSIHSLDNGSENELLVFIADKMANILSIKEDILCGVDVWNKFNASKEDIEWYYRSIQKGVERKLGERRIYTLFSSTITEVFQK